MDEFSSLGRFLELVDDGGLGPELAGGEGGSVGDSGRCNLASSNS